MQVLAFGHALAHGGFHLLLQGLELDHLSGRLHSHGLHVSCSSALLLHGPQHRLLA